MRREPPRDVAVLIPGAVRVPIADAIWGICKDIERDAALDCCAARADRMDRLVELLSKVAREVSP